MSHRCHARGCTKTVGDDLLMCVRHWRMVPRDIQKRVWAAYLNLGSLSPPHIEACDEAVAAVAEKEGTSTP